MNNLDDISYLTEYHTFCGFTEEEVRTNFKAHIGSIASLKGILPSFLLQILTLLWLRRTTNYYWNTWDFFGYRFIPTIEASQQVISPQLFYSYLKHQEIDQASWFSTGSSSFWLEVFKDADPEFLKNMISENTTLSMNDILNSVDPKVFKNKVPLLLFQTGYLTFEQTTAE